MKQSILGPTVPVCDPGYRSGAPIVRIMKTMIGEDRRLLRHLLVVVAVKLVLLALLWWVFVREHRVPVDAGQAAVRMGVAAPAAETPR